MTPAYLHEQLMQACENGNVSEAKQWLSKGAEVNFNIKNPRNALDTAIQADNYTIVELILEHEPIIKEYVLQKAIEKDKKFLDLLIPDFTLCKDESLLTGTLLAAINIGDLNLAKQAITQGAKPASLFLYAALNIANAKILQLLIENGFNIHADTNMILTEWMGSSAISDWGKQKPERHDLLIFISEYYLEKQKSIEKFKSWSLADKSRLFRMGLDSNNLNMMKFSVLIGVHKNESLNSALNRYYSKEHQTSKKVSNEIIKYILDSDISFTKVSISNAVCFNYSEVLNVLRHMHDLEYAYEMSYTYENDALQNYFIDQGVDQEAQHLTKMKVSAIKGNIKEVRKAVSEGAKVKNLDTDVIVEIINKNHVEILKYLYDSGIVFDTSFNKYLDRAMNVHNAYDSVTYLIELGLDITSVRNIPRAYKREHPSFFDMWEKRFFNIFTYTIYLVKEVYPTVEGKKKEEVLEKIAEFSTLPYVIKMSEEKSLEH